MQVIVAKSAGFCYGVRRAVELAEAAVHTGCLPAMLGPVIHNDQVVTDLCRQGARLIQCACEARSAEAVIIRAHGSLTVPAPMSGGFRPLRGRPWRKGGRWS